MNTVYVHVQSERNQKVPAEHASSVMFCKNTIFYYNETIGLSENKTSATSKATIDFRRLVQLLVSMRSCDSSRFMLFTEQYKRKLRLCSHCTGY